jgi:diguanylate cyclase (GGDEF)-like protein
MLLVLLAAAPGLGLLGYAHVTERAAIGRAAEAHATRQAYQAAANHDRHLAAARQLLAALAQLQHVLENDTRRCSRLFATLLARYPQYANLGAISPGGELFCSALPASERLKLGDRGYFQRALRSRDFSVGEHEVDPVTGRATVSVGFPALDESGVPGAVVYAALDLSAVNQQMREAQLPAGGVLMIVDHQGAVLAEYPEPDHAGRISVLGTPIAPLLRRNQGPVEAAGRDGVSRVYASTMLQSAPTQPVFAVAGVPTGPALAEADRVLGQNLSVLALVTLLTLAGARFYGVRFILRPMQKLLTATERLRAGDLAARAEELSRDEFGTMARAFNSMAERLEAIVLAERLRSREIERCKELGDLLSACPTLHEACAVAARVLAPMFPGERGMVWMASPAAAPGSKAAALEPVAAWGTWSGRRPDVLRPEDCWAIRCGRPHFIGKDAVPLRCEHQPAGVTASGCLPLVAHGETLGLLHLLPGAERGQALGEDTERLAAGVAAVLGLSFANLRMRDNLRDQSTRDHLTGLLNRRSMEDALEREIGRAGRLGGPLSLLVLDLDHFKRVNDAFGHQFGDSLLKEIGQVLRLNVRSTDVACRYGGEEFVVLLPGADVEAARARAERLRELVEQVGTAQAGRIFGPMTLSVGLAVFPDHAVSGRALLEADDRALYEAKQQGRNRVVVAAAP